MAIGNSFKLTISLPIAAKVRQFFFSRDFKAEFDKNVLPNLLLNFENKTLKNTLIINGFNNIRALISTHKCSKYKAFKNHSGIRKKLALNKCRYL